MPSKYNLKRFLDAQSQIYPKALNEIKNGHKVSHWMWFIFPQLKGLGHSDRADFYGIADLDEAAAYLSHPVLGKRLVEIASVLLEIEGKTAHTIFGSPDDVKLCSSMTLFANVKEADVVFGQVMDKYFNGRQDEFTIRGLLKK